MALAIGTELVYGCSSTELAYDGYGGISFSTEGGHVGQARDLSEPAEGESKSVVGPYPVCVAA
eukprot:168600-Rhodomonas_salina.1